MWREAHYRAVIDTASVAILVIDDRGSIQSVNAAVERTFGYGTAELIGRGLKLLVPQDAEIRNLHVDADETAGEPKIVGADHNLFGRRKDGSHFPAELSISAWRSDAGQRYLTGIIRDVSESQTVAAALREHRGWLRTVSDAALVGLLVVDKKHRIRYANPAFVVLNRLASNDIIGRGMGDILPEVYDTEIRARLDATFAGAGRSYESVQKDALSPSGLRYFSTTYEPSCSAFGDEVAVIVLSDVTDLKRSEAELRASRDLLQSVLDGMLDAIFAKDGTGRYVVLNEAGARFVGHNRGEVLGKTDHDFADDDTASLYRLQDLRVMKTGEPHMAERTLTIDGEHRHLAISKARWKGPDGSALGVVGIVRDVTEQQLLAEERRAIAKRLLSAQEQERLRIARDLHDQVDQDLTALSLGLASLKSVVAGNADAQAKLAWLRCLTDKVSRNLHRNALALEPASLDHLGLKQAIASHVVDIGARFGLETVLCLDDLDACELDADTRIALFRAVQESMTNILKHAKASTVTVIAERDGVELCMIVEDDGRGFEAHRAGAASTSSGLGLLGIRERLAVVGGAIDIKSTPGMGTTIFLLVPIPGDRSDEPRSNRAVNTRCPANPDLLPIRLATSGKISSRRARPLPAISSKLARMP